MAELQLDYSTYQYAGNNPIINIDVLGLTKSKAEKERKKRERQDRRKAKAKRRQAKRKKGVNLKGQHNNTRKRNKAENQKDKEAGKASGNGGSNDDGSDEPGAEDGSTSTEPGSGDDSYDGLFEALFEMLSKGEVERVTGPLGDIGLPGPTPRPVIIPTSNKPKPSRRFNSNDNPTLVGDWYNRLNGQPQKLEKLRNELYTQLPYNQALALYNLALLGQNHSPVAKQLELRQAAIENFYTENEFGKGGADKDPPSSTSEEALAVIPASLEQSEHFPNVNPEEFLRQLRERVAEGGHEATNQGFGTNFCWAAAITKHTYENNPKGMAEAMIGLYENGTFEYDNNDGGMSVPVASQAARDAVGSDVFDDNQNVDEGRTINELDQMLFMTLADHYDSGLESYLNWIDPDYDPGDEENAAWSGAPLSKAVEVLKDFGYDVDVRGSDVLGDPFLTIGDLQEAIETDDVILFVHSGAFKDNTQSANWTGTHYIHIISIEQVGDKYKIGYWDYGDKREVKMNATQFWVSVYGMIQIPKAND